MRKPEPRKPDGTVQFDKLPEARRRFNIWKPTARLSPGRLNMVTTAQATRMAEAKAIAAPMVAIGAPVWSNDDKLTRIDRPKLVKAAKPYAGRRW